MSTADRMLRALAPLLLASSTAWAAEQVLVPGSVDAYDQDSSKDQAPIGRERAKEMPAGSATITVDPRAEVGPLSPYQIGYNLEDLTYQLSPGLGANMIYGESFEDEPDVALPSGWEALLAPQNPETPKDPALLRRWRGAWSFEGGTLSMVGSRQRRIWTSAVTLTDGSVRCALLQDHRGRSGCGAGLLVAMSASGCYYLQLSPENASVALLRVGAEQRSFPQNGARVAAKRVSDLAFDRFYRVVVERRGAVLTVSLDGAPLLSWTDPQPLPPGGVGLDSSNGWNSFRELSVTSHGEEWKADFTTADRPYRHGDHISRWWDPVVTGDAQARFTWCAEAPYNTDRCQRLECTAGDGTVGVANTGLHNGGLAVRQGWAYQGRLYLRGDCGSAVIALQSRDGATTYAQQTLAGVGAEWRRFDIALPPATATSADARCAVWMTGRGRLDVDQVTLLPPAEGLFHGLPVRRDLGEKLTAGISHIRFGGDMINTWNFDWRAMTAPADRRRQYPDGWNYHESAAFGIFEFLDFCRAAQVEPLVNLGEHLDAAEVAAFVEYANGGPASAGGRQRIADGRAEPYGLKRIMYGNGLPRTDELEQLVDRLARMEPPVRVVAGDAGHLPWALISRRDPARAAALNRIAGRLEAFGSRPETPYLGSPAIWDRTMADAQQAFPSLGHGTAYYAGEINGAYFNWHRGLTNAMMVIASERRGALVWGHAFCNALQASGHLYEWNQGQIHFTPSASWYQPGGWVTRMLGEHVRAVALKTTCTGPTVRVEAQADTPTRRTTMDVPAVWASASRDAAGGLLTLKVVSLWGGPLTTTIELGDHAWSRAAGVGMDSLLLAQTNTLEEPDRLVPHPVALPASGHGRLDLVLPAMSVTIIDLQR